MNAIVIDKGGRRSGIDRRVFLYAVYLPERRIGNDRRNGYDRRSGAERRGENRLKGDRRKSFYNFT